MSLRVSRSGALVPVLTTNPQQCNVAVKYSKRNMTSAMAGVPAAESGRNYSAQAGMSKEQKHTENHSY